MSQGRSPRHSEPLVIVGRDDELRHLSYFVDRLRIQGEPLLLSGDAGVGKTVLLDAAAQYARAQGYRVVHAAGVEFEAGVSFAALHLVLQPLLGELEYLTEWHRDALTTALGLREGPRSDQLVLSNATLAILAAAASSAPLLLIVDDLPWIDRASAAVLGFVARRLGQIPVGLQPAGPARAASRPAGVARGHRRRLPTPGRAPAVPAAPGDVRHPPGAAASAGPGSCCSPPCWTAPATWSSSTPSPAHLRRTRWLRRNGPGSSVWATAAAESRSGIR